MRQAIGLGGPLAGKISSSPQAGTFEALDPVRYIGNRSSGRMGYSLAQSALDAGATRNPDLGSEQPHTALWRLRGADRERGTDECRRPAARYRRRGDPDDCRSGRFPTGPSRAVKRSRRRRSGGLTLELDRNPDIIGGLRDAPLLRIGFAAETSDHIANGTDKLRRKNLDMVVVNDAIETIGSPTITGTLITRNGDPVTLPTWSRSDSRQRLWSASAHMLGGQ